MSASATIRRSLRRRPGRPAIARLLLVFVAGAAGLLAGPAIPTALAANASLTVDASQRRARINPTQFGEFLEEINHSGDGGIYAELIRNRDLKEDPSSPVYWSAVTGGGRAAASRWTRRQGPNSANPVSLELSVGISAGRRPGRGGQRRLLGHPGQAVDHLSGVVLREDSRPARAR